jgi:glycosyltransferase involved in cell wall biosynthesis
MKILRLANGALPSTSAYRLHKYISKYVDSIYVCGFSEVNDPTLKTPKTNFGRFQKILNNYLDTVPARILHPKRPNTPFSLSYTYCQLIKNYYNRYNPSIIHLHWVCSGFLSIELLKEFESPIVWTLHSSWPFTGGCHDQYECKNYMASCGKCWQLNSSNSFDLSRWVWKRKQKNWRSLDITLVSPCNWMADCAKQSSLFKHANIITIPHGLDINIFKPTNKEIARSILNLPADKIIILFGAMDPNDKYKGYYLLKNALKKLIDRGWKNKFIVVLFGNANSELLKADDFEKISMGYVPDNTTMSLLYSAADLTCVPSFIESFSNVTCESMSCETPVVGFAATGLLDLIDHQINGYLAKPYESEDLCNGIEWIIQNNNLKEISKLARHKVMMKFDIEKIALKYVELYQKISKSE